MSTTINKKIFGKPLLSNPVLVFGLSGVLGIAGFWFAYQFVEPAPPNKIVISAGSEEGAYYLFARRYQELLANSHITLEIRSSNGTIDNLKRLKSADSDIDIAFVQGGVSQVSDDNTLLSIGSLYYEPIWVFYRNDSPIRYLTELSGKIIAIGSQGSGTRVVALNLLEASDVTQAPTVLLDLGGQDAADALSQGTVHAAFFIAGPQSPLIRKLLMTDSIELMDFAQAKAYARLYPYLSSLTLPEGAIELRRNIPSTETHLIAATANLVVRSDFHPALIDLLLQTATTVHGKGGLFEAYGEFPSPKYLEYPLSNNAERFYRRGPPFLRRYLPFWLATFIERILVMAIPVLALLLPLFKLAPPLYQWAIRSKIYRWYKAVKNVESRYRGIGTVSVDSLNALRKELDSIENKANEISVPLAYTDQLYNLRVHINLVRSYLDQDLENSDSKRSNPKHEENTRQS